ncbi:MAG: S8/S53 family peptidase [Candidatus Eremiobacteraeota bacterium]|nr:S8/S53 family peptidase [Candidatus Eremiobacteraeota bacterium]
MPTTGNSLQPSNLGAHTTRGPHTGSVPAGWAATATQAFNLSNASDLGALAASKTITVRLGLQMRSPDQLASLVAGGQQISPSTFNATYAPTQTQVSAATAYLQSHGFSNIAVEPNNLLISATGTAAQASQAFNTTLHAFSQNGTTVFANVTPAYVPQNLGGNVIAVLGLSNAPTMKPTPKFAPTPCSVEGVTTPRPVCLRFYDPATFNVTYDAASLPTASSTPVAIMAEGTVSQSITDFRTNEQEFALPHVPVNVVQVGLQSTDTSGDGEWTLDMTYSSGMAGNLSTIYLYDTTSLTDSDIALEYNRWVTQDLTHIANSSFGGCDYGPYLDGSMVVDDEILLEGAAQGQTMFVSTGDSGSFCSVGLPNGVPAGEPFVEYPAASPYVVAVGGTDLFSNADGTYKGESAWEAGGGGVSQFEYSPYWEAGEQRQAKNGLNDRGLPDIAMDAALETGALLWGGSAVNGSCTPCITGGTSLASPLAAGAYARMQTAHGNALGFAPPYFYTNYGEHRSNNPALAGPPTTNSIGGFHDILVGSNGLYTALPRYDFTTGLGSFDIATMNAQIGQ